MSNYNYYFDFQCFKDRNNQYIAWFSPLHFSNSTKEVKMIKKQYIDEYIFVIDKSSGMLDNISTSVDNLFSPGSPHSPLSPHNMTAPLLINNLEYEGGKKISFANNKNEILKDAMTKILHQILLVDKTINISALTFNNETKLFFKHTNVQNVQEISFDEIPNGTKNIEKAITEVKTIINDDYYKGNDVKYHVLLFIDGYVDVKNIDEFTDSLFKLNASIYCIVVGPSYDCNVQFMEKITSAIINGIDSTEISDKVINLTCNKKMFTTNININIKDAKVITFLEQTDSILHIDNMCIDQHCPIILDKCVEVELQYMYKGNIISTCFDMDAVCTKSITVDLQIKYLKSYCTTLDLFKKCFVPPDETKLVSKLLGLKKITEKINIELVKHDIHLLYLSKLWEVLKTQINNYYNDILIHDELKQPRKSKVEIGLVTLEKKEFKLLQPFSKIKHNTCRICKTNNINIILFPCKHYGMCDSCEITMNKCPFCSTSIQYTKKIIMVDTNCINCIDNPVGCVLLCSSGNNHCCYCLKCVSTKKKKLCPICKTKIKGVVDFYRSSI